MHPEAYAFVERTVDFRHFDEVLEIGSRQINGDVRSLFGGSRYYGIDIEPGPGVDELADAATWRNNRRFDCVVCCEVLEHSPVWRDIVVTAWTHLHPDGLLVVTCATDPRAPHSASDGGQLAPGEHYGNVDPGDMDAQMVPFAARGVEVHEDRGDLYAWGIK